MSAKNVNLFTNTPTNATAYSPWVDTNGAVSANVHLSWAGTSSPEAVFTMEWSNDPLAGKEAALGGTPAAGSAKLVDVTAAIPAGNILGTGLTATGGATGSTIIGVENPPRYLRIKYTRASGGSASAFLNGWISLGGV
jgi:hypothetical protein